MTEGGGGTDPASGITKGLLPTPGTMQPAVKTLADARKLLADINASTFFPPTKLASRLLALTAMQPGTVL